MTITKKTHLEEIKNLYNNLKSSEKVAKAMSDKYQLAFNGTLSRKIRRWLNLPKQNVESEQFNKAVKRKVVKGSKFYIITSAQNQTPVNKALFENIKAYSKFIGATIEVIPLRYKNPTSVFSDKEHDVWAAELDEFLIANRHSLNSNITVLADVKTQLTASEPLSGMEGLTGIESSIIGHPRQHMKVTPTLEGYPKKIMLTTGSITEPNYTDSKAGKKGEFHHVYGFCIVEIINNKSFNIRQVSAHKNGVFYDLDFKVQDGKVSKEKDAVSAVVLGDLHLGNHNDEALKVTYEMLERFNPSNVILHDINDGHSINHHEKNDPFAQLRREQDGSYSIKREIEQMLMFLDTIIHYNPVVVRSNHDDFFDRWLINSDWRKELNKMEYLHYAYLKSNGILDNGIVPYEIEQKFGKKVLCLNENSTFRVRGIELGQHGHIGKGGSRGSANQFSRLNTKMVTAHSHTPFKKDGLTGVGTLTNLRMGYNKGLSDWAHSNVIVNKNGKTQNLLIFNGQYSIIEP